MFHSYVYFLFLPCCTLHQGRRSDYLKAFFDLILDSSCCPNVTELYNIILFEEHLQAIHLLISSEFLCLFSSSLPSLTSFLPSDVGGGQMRIPPPLATPLNQTTDFDHASRGINDTFYR